MTFVDRMDNTMSILKRIANNEESSSVATSMRRKRFEFFLSLLQTLPRPIRIIDIGGEEKFWGMMNFVDDPGVHVVLVNLEARAPSHANFESVAGDARNLSHYMDHEFDVAFSNSVIEHVGTFSDQQHMATEVQRVAKRYFMQTPNYYFPIEPHFLFPAFQWLPITLRTSLVQHFKLGWFPKMPEKQQAREAVESIRLMKKQELLSLFPNAELYEEKLLGLTKSFVVYEGWR